MSFTYKEIKNLLPKKQYLMIKDCLEDSSSFPWFLNKSGATVEKHVEKQQSEKFKSI